MGKGEGNAPQLRTRAGSKDGGGHLRRGIPYGNWVSDGVCVLHGKLEPSQGGSGCTDEAFAQLYEDLFKNSGKEQDVREGSGRQDGTGCGYQTADRGTGAGNEK